MQGHKKLIPELKLNDNLRKLRGVTPTPTPTPTDSNVHVYHIEANMVEHYNYSDCTINDGGELYNKILADYQQYGNEHLYILKVKSIYPGDDWCIDDFFLSFYDGGSVINMYAFSEEDGEVLKIFINQNRIYIESYTNSSYDHTTVEITDQNELYVYEAEQEDRDPVEYLIDDIVSYYGVNTCIMLETPEIPFCTLNQTCHFMDGSKQVYQICGYFDGGLITLTLSNDNGTYDWSLE